MAQRHAQHASCVMGPLAQDEGEPRVVFYRLRRKFVDSEKSVPEDSRDIIYYTLAVGHHTGVIDCLEEELACTAGEYRQLVGALPAGRLRRKLEGVLRGGEIQVDRTHARSLRGELDGLLSGAGGAALGGPFAGADAAALSPAALAWLECFSGMLDAALADPAVYYMGRLRG